MDIFVVAGPTPLTGEITVAGAKNVALKALVATLLTDEEVILENIPHIGDVAAMADVLKSLGATVSFSSHTARIQSKKMLATRMPLELGARLRTSSMVVGPLLARSGNATIPNPGGCRIGARPIDRHIQGLMHMGAHIRYHSEDGYFHASAPQGLHGVTFEFPKNTHTGTETLMLAAVLAKGTTILKNAAEEVEVDDLIGLLSRMGAHIRRSGPREIIIEGVEALHGVSYRIAPDRNEEVTFAIAAAITNGSIVVHASQQKALDAFTVPFLRAGGGIEVIDQATTRYFRKGPLIAMDVTTAPYPGFMTDWQAPWAVLMTQARGVSTIHETVFESRFSYVRELQKMGAKIDFYDPEVKNPESFYNFNWVDRVHDAHQGIRITGPTPLHNAILDIADLRAGATLLLAALVAQGESVVHGVAHIDRGYEHIEDRLRVLGAHIKRIQEGDI